MKRYRISSKFRFTTFVVIVILMGAFLISGLLGLSDVISETSDSYTTVTVATGDTIWSIAEEHSDDRDIRRVVYDIRQMNGLDDCQITSGEHLMIPVYDS